MDDAYLQKPAHLGSWKANPVSACLNALRGPKPSKQASRLSTDLGLKGGLNKKQRIEQLIQRQSGGHQWKASASTSTNFTATCQVCSLYIQQVMPLEHFGRIEQHLCAHLPCPVPPLFSVHRSHSLYNLGKLWICTKCFGILTPGAGKTAKVLLNPCEPNCPCKRPAVADFLPREPYAAPFTRDPNTEPISYKQKHVTASAHNQASQSKLLQFFSVQASGVVPETSTGLTDRSPTGLFEAPFTKNTSPLSPIKLGQFY